MPAPILPASGVPTGFFQLGAGCGMSSASGIVFPEDVCAARTASPLQHIPTGRKAKGSLSHGRDGHSHDGAAKPPRRHKGGFFQGSWFSARGLGRMVAWRTTPDPGKMINHAAIRCKMEGSHHRMARAAAEGAWEGICGVAQDPAAFARYGHCQEGGAVPAGSGTEQAARLPQQWHSGTLHNLGLAKQAGRSGKSSCYCWCSKFAEFPGLICGSGFCFGTAKGKDALCTEERKGRLWRLIHPCSLDETIFVVHKRF